MAEEEVKESLDEISLEEFEELSAEKPTRGKVSEDALLASLGATAKKTSVIAKKFGVTYSANSVSNLPN